MSLKQREVKFKPRIKLSHNICTIGSFGKATIIDKSTWKVEQLNSIIDPFHRQYI